MSGDLPFRVSGIVAGLIISLLVWYFVFTKILGIQSDYKILQTTENLTPIFIVSNGAHTDICLPVDSIWHSFLSNEYINNANFVSFGWGDKGFYLDTPTWGDLKLSTALKAICIPSETAMHVTYWKNAPVEKPNSIIKLQLNKIDLSALRDHIISSFKSKNGKAFIIKNADSYSGRPNEFYEATGKYHAIRTCNEWTRQAIETANQPVPTWTPLAGDLMNALEAR